MQKSIKIGYYQLIALLIFSSALMAENGTDVYIFPLRPGMPEWKNLQTHDEMLSVLQIPENILSNMSTPALVETCLNYPLFIDFYAIDDFQISIEQIIFDFNGIGELLKRQDSGEELIKKYAAMSPDALDSKWEIIQQGRYVLEFVKIEILLAQDAVLTGLKKDKLDILLNEALFKHEAMVQNPAYGNLIFRANAYLMGKIMMSVDFDSLDKKSRQNENFNKFLRSGLPYSGELINEIVLLAKQYLNK